MSAIALATRSFTPLAFKPRIERYLTAALVLSALSLWLIVLPLEFVLG